MDREEIIAAAQELCRQGAPFVLATVGEDGGPRMRWMGALYLEEPMTIYMAGGVHQRKMSQIRANPLGQLMFNAPDFGQVVTLFGECAVVNDADVKRKLWETIPQLANYMSGPDDPEFGVVRFDTKKIELLSMSAGGLKPEVAEL
jgi:general stress protein 26